MTVADRPTLDVAPARLVGVDVARAFALLAMFPRHIGPFGLEGSWPTLPWLWEVSRGRAVIAFTVVAGISVAIISRRYTAVDTSTRLSFRAAWLLGLGCALALLDNDVEVILSYYAPLMILAAVATHRSTRWLVVATVVAFVGGTAAYGWLLLQRVELFTRGGGEPSLAVELLATGYYPTLLYAGPLLVGLLVGRQLLRDGRLSRSVLVGAVAALTVAQTVGAVFAEYGETSRLGFVLVRNVGHSGTPVWLVQATAIAVLVVAFSTWLVDRVSSGLVRVLAALGRSALTIYVVHLFVLVPVAADRPETLRGGVVIFALFVVGAVTIAWSFGRWGGSGPLERLDRAAWDRTVRPLGRRVSRRAPGAEGTPAAHGGGR